MTDRVAIALDGFVPPFDSAEGDWKAILSAASHPEALSADDPNDVELMLRVLTLRYALDGGCPQTLEQVGTQLDITRERVRQIERRALLGVYRKEEWSVPLNFRLVEGADLAADLRDDTLRELGLDPWELSHEEQIAAIEDAISRGRIDADQISALRELGALTATHESERRRDAK